MASNTPIYNIAKELNVDTKRISSLDQEFSRDFKASVIFILSIFTYNKSWGISSVVLFSLNRKNICFI